MKWNNSLDSIDMLPARFSQRFLAWVLDIFIGVWIACIAFIALSHYIFPITNSLEERFVLFQDGTNMLGAFVILSFIVYQSVTTTLFKGTFGKIICGIEVQDDVTGGRLSPIRSLIRTVFWYISFLLFGFGFSSIALLEKKKAFHDIIAGCIVIQTPSRVSYFKTAITMIVLFHIVVAILFTFASVPQHLFTLLFG